jgi:hypothetical protein
MRYHDGQIASVGDVVNLAGKIGRVVCSIDDGKYSTKDRPTVACFET